MVKKLLTILSITSYLMVHLVPLISSSGDEFMSCDRYFESRRESRVLEKIPCDMSKVTYCKHKGASYPEAAIWRFKEENRALMRRMYGDMESTSVYRQMRSSMSPEQEDLEFKNQERHQTERQSVTLGSGFMPDLFSSLEYNIRMGSGLATVQSAKEPIVERIVENGMIKVKRKIVKKKKTEPENVKVETSTTSSTSSVFATTSESPSPGTTVTTMVPNPTTTMNQQMMTTTQPSMSQDTDVTVLDIDDTTTDIPMMVDWGENAEGPMLPSLALPALPAESKNNDFIIEDYTNYPDHSIEPNVDDVDIAEEEKEVEEEIVEEIEEIIEKLEYSGESLNACPVKEEVFAPYWANNTRDQVLALLNLYPFEQYIHMETCKFEHEEMLCRKGCRCEQQYRLHRLLAFDPNNECRGIFSDWFRFPSYCICKCYNVPEDFLPKKARKPKVDHFHSEILKNIEVKQDQKENKILSPESLQNIPAFLPYEAKQALLRELSRSDRDLPVHNVKEMNMAAEVLEEVEEAQDKSKSSATGATVPDTSDSHFFYANSPVMEFNLANGKSGSVGQTPRK